jgi:hypothetical protein
MNLLDLETFRELSTEELLYAGGISLYWKDNSYPTLAGCLDHATAVMQRTGFTNLQRSGNGLFANRSGNDAAIGCAGDLVVFTSNDGSALDLFNEF